MEKNITVRLTARLFAEEKCFGPGVARLLEAVDELHSLRSAAQSMNMAYSKAWAIVHGAEQGFGCKLLHSTIGGAGGGGAGLQVNGDIHTHHAPWAQKPNSSPNSVCPYSFSRRQYSP